MAGANRVLAENVPPSVRPTTSSRRSGASKEEAEKKEAGGRRTGVAGNGVQPVNLPMIATDHIPNPARTKSRPLSGQTG